MYQTGIKELEAKDVDEETRAYPALVDGRLLIVKGTNSSNAWSVPSID